MINKVKEIIIDIKRRVYQFCDGRVEQIKTATAKIMLETMKAFIISTITIITLFAIRLFSKGNFAGEELENYLKENLSQCIGTKGIRNHILYNGSYSVLSEDNIIIVYSEYLLPTDRLGMLDYASGRCLSIFERKERNVLNDILDTEPAYEISFCCTCEAGYGLLNCENFEYKDCDQDNEMEFLLYTISRFATRSSRELFLIEKKENNWTIVSPDVSKMKKKIIKVTDKNVHINVGENFYPFKENKEKDVLNLQMEVFRFNDILKKNTFYDVVGIGEEGIVCFLKNPLNAAFEMCYQISCVYQGSFEKDYIYIMQQYNDKKIFIDPKLEYG